MDHSSGKLSTTHDRVPYSGPPRGHAAPCCHSEVTRPPLLPETSEEGADKGKNKGKITFLGGATPQFRRFAPDPSMASGCCLQLPARVGKPVYECADACI